MASREIRDLSPEMQVLYNKFYDRCRRDTGLLKEGISVILLCTYRSEEEQEKLLARGLIASKKNGHSHVDVRGKPSAEAFDIGVLLHVVMTGGDMRIAEHAEAVGLIQSEPGTFRKPK